MRPLLFALLATGCATHAPAVRREAPSGVLPISVEGTSLRVTGPDGRVVGDDELIGAILVSRNQGGLAAPVRIDAVTRSGELTLYTFSALNAETGAWENVCEPDIHGGQQALALEGTRTETGDHLRAPGQFEIACTSGAVAKCVSFGYRPWQSEAMWDLHQACTRMVTADYCGDGRSHTRDGTLIDVFDRVGIQLDEPGPGMTFEAGWGKDGATCVARPRVPDVARLDDIAAECPERVLGPACSEDAARRDPRSLLFNRS